MKKNPLFKSFCLVGLFVLFFLQIEGQVKSQKRSAVAKPASAKRLEIQRKKLRDEISAQRAEVLAQLKKAQEENKPTNFYVFVGEKVEVKPFELKAGNNAVFMDFAFEAKYRVLENLYGNYDKETIEFKVFDHYGAPHFAKYKNVLLFVSEHKGKLYHEKYQFFDVYKTKNGKWASCGDPYKFDDYHRKNIKPVKLEFEDEVSFDIREKKSALVKKIYPAPFYKIEGKKAICLMGAYIEDLFMVKKNGVLKARGLFE